MKTTLSPEAQRMAESLAKAFMNDQEGALTIYEVAQEKAKKEAPNYEEWQDKDKWTFAIRYAFQYGAALALHLMITEPKE